MIAKRITGYLYTIVVKTNTKPYLDGQLQLSDTWIYGPVEQQPLYIKVFTQIWKLMEEELTKLKNSATTQENFWKIS